MTETGPKPTVRPPKHLKAATKKWFVKVIGEWQLEPHHILLLVGCSRGARSSGGGASSH